MKILIKRIAKKDNYTIGKLYINGQYFCDTLEDKDRGLKQSDNVITIKAKKIFGNTAIPSGTYNVILSYSPKFKKYLPLVENVKGFSGIRIHQGNTANDTEGCILVGKNNIVGMVTHSEDTLKALMQKLNVNDNITLTIE
ncbi:MAG TPA: hypothetical protein DIS88_01720 [Prevotella sp.]|nr:hypothetical protein [Prevotella sp.]